MSATEADLRTAADFIPAPAPVPDYDTAFVWDGFREHRLLLQRCLSCSKHRFPPLPSCPYCGSPASEISELSGRGTVYSWVVVHRAFHPAFESRVPYTIATVDLEEGPRMLGALEGAPGAMDLAVVGEFVDHETWTELRFRAKGSQ